MTLYVVHHGDARPASEDPARPLSARGRADVERLAALLGRLGVRVARIEHSGKPRAAETAAILAGGVGCEFPPRARTGLAPDDPVAPLVAELDAAAEDVMLVGHLPHLRKLVAQLVAGRGEPPVVGFVGSGTLVRLERAGGRSVAWVLPPALA